MSTASEIRLNREIKASPKQVFELISKGLLFTATGILPRSLKQDFTPGGKFSFEWISGGFCEGEFTAIEEPRKIKFSWISRGCRHPAETATTVEIMLQPSRTGTALSLAHTGFGTKESHDSHDSGWASSLDDFGKRVAFFDQLGNYKWDNFDVVLSIRSTPEKLFRRWATSAGMESFFIKKMELKDTAGKLRTANEEMMVGDRFEWEWWHQSSNKNYGRVLAVEKGKSISFTFGESEVTVRFIAHGGSTWLHIRQSKIPEFPEARAGLHVGCRSGWTYFATVLRALEENGIDIRDKNPETAGSLSMAFVIPEQREAA